MKFNMPNIHSVDMYCLPLLDLGNIYSFDMDNFQPINMDEEKEFVIEMFKWFILGNRKRMKGKRIGPPFKALSCSPHFSYDTMVSLLILMRKIRVRIFPHPIPSPEFEEEINVLRQSFSGRKFFEFCICVMKRAVEDFIIKDVEVFSIVIDRIVNLLEDLKRNNIISRNFLYELKEISLEIIKENEEQKKNSEQMNVSNKP